MLNFVLDLCLHIRALVWWRTCVYSGTPVKGHHWIKDTSLIRTLDQVPTSYKCVLFDPWNEDTSLIRTHFVGPRVSVLEICVYVQCPDSVCALMESVHWTVTKRKLLAGKIGKKPAQSLTGCSYTHKSILEGTSTSQLPHFSLNELLQIWFFC